MGGTSKFLLATVILQTALPPGKKCTEPATYMICLIPNSHISKRQNSTGQQTYGVVLPTARKYTRSYIRKLKIPTDLQSLL